jgi:putative ABC transport system substrate-binding protein
MSPSMKRREFITLLGGAAAALPLSARAQQGGRMRRIGVLMFSDENDPFTKSLLSGLRQGLEALGWTDGRNVRMDIRWAAANADRVQMLAKELADLQPDAIVVNSNPVTIEMQRQTRTIPIVFVGSGDPVAGGMVKSISRPEGNTTGFAYLFSSIGGKWLELLREAAPHVTRVAIPSNPISPGSYNPSAETAAVQFGVQTSIMSVRNATETERAIEAFAAAPNGGLIVSPSARVGDDSGLISRLAMRLRLPAIYYDKSHVAEGGLMSYGPDTAVLFRGGASYVDRILRGAQPSELPVQFPARFELVVNLRTAKAMGLTIPESFLVGADQVIE